MNGTLITAQIGTIRTLVDGSVSMTFVTPELSPGKVGEFFALRNKVAYLYVSANQIENSEKKMVDALDPELPTKTPGQRLRAVLYRLWEQDAEGYKDSDSYYRAKMESIINGLKAELNP